MGTPDREPERMLTMSSGGWAIVAGLLIGLVIVGWRLSKVSFGQEQQGRGDGKTLESYGFDLTKTDVPIADIVPAKMAKDYVMALVDPGHIAGTDVPTVNKAQRGKFLVPRDTVIGVAINGDACAYPLRFMIWHEIVNDVVGGVPIAVTYNFLTDSAAVFRRTIDDTVCTFGVSGLVYRSNLVLYDRRANHVGESLWSQMGERAIAGPLSGTRLERLPARVLAWGAWYNRHPGSAVLEPPPKLVMKKLYNTKPRPLYAHNKSLLFPFGRTPPESSGVHLKEKVIAVTIGDTTRVYPIERLRAAASDDHIVTVEQAGLTLRFTCDRNSRTAEVEIPATDRPTRVDYANWVGWYAFHPDDELWAGA